MAVFKQILASLIGIAKQPSVPQLLANFLSNVFLIHRPATLNISRNCFFNHNHMKRSNKIEGPMISCLFCRSRVRGTGGYMRKGTRPQTDG